jgi:hypothetical protein
MATSDNPFVSVPKTEIDSHAVHQHYVPIVNVEDDRETLEHDATEDVEEVLLDLDEADALFGKRGGVKDGHDRY